MALQLNTTTSIVDYLKSKNQGYDFSSRKSLYESSGINERLGSYIGSADQNVALLKYLNTSSSPSTTPTTTSSIGSFQGVPINPGTDAEIQAQIAAIRAGQTSTPTATSTLNTAQAPTQPPTIGSSGLTADAVSASIPPLPSASDVLSTVMNSPGFQNFLDQQNLSSTLATGKAEAEKLALERKTESLTKDFIDTMGRRGLFFSGATKSGIAALAEELAASKLGVDRALAGELLESDLKTRGEILKQVESVVKDAQDGRKEALAALDKVGLTIVGDRIMPTLAAQREERLIQTAEFNQEATMERLRLSEEAAARAEQYLALAISRGDGGGGTLNSGGLSVSNGAVGQAALELNQTRGEDGWVDPNAYLSLYTDWISKKGLAQDFVKAFPPNLYVNPANTTLPTFLQNKQNQTLIINPQAISDALSGVSATE